MPTPPAYPAIDIVIPFYRNAYLVTPIFASLTRIASELRNAECTVVAINDSPGDAELEAALAAAVERLERETPCRGLKNERNLGFVRAANSGMQAAVDAGHDVILLNSDTEVFPGSIAEMRRVAYQDPMTAFVSPRSNNATICSLPHQAEFRGLAPDEAYANFRELSKHLPEFHYLPTAVGFCLYIKHLVLKEFGLFDEAYGAGYNEENDLIMRANRCGYRAVAANHAFVYHAGESSFSTSQSPKDKLETRNAQLLNRRYPEYARGLADYLGSPRYQGERMLATLLPDTKGRLDVVFDFSSVGPYHNGTFVNAIQILKRAVNLWSGFARVHVMISEEALRFHKLHQVEHLRVVRPDEERLFAVAFRLGQPFEYVQLRRLSRIAPINVYAMLDTIALDCLYLNQVDLPVIWGTVFSHADGVLYISDFSAEQFRRRFCPRPGLREMVAYLSLDLRDYAPERAATAVGEHILVIGNTFAHKHVRPTVDALSRAFPGEKIVALGLNSHDGRNVRAYAVGNLSETLLCNILHGAKFIVFPSHYEGFGIPVLEGLAHSKPVLARAIPVLRTVRGKIEAAENLILYQSTEELIARLKQGFPAWKPGGAERNGAASANWDALTVRIGEFLQELLQHWSFSGTLLPRLEHMQLLAARVDRPAPSVTVLAADEGADDTIDPSRRIADLNQMLRDRESRIRDLHNSWSWRITAPLRMMTDAYLRLVKK